ncbi:HD-GYP domain-containing protein [Methylomagnum ishizawai]|nr:HD domain-containing phosphohydrolase [Methylomagnum ishizawai]
MTVIGAVLLFEFNRVKLVVHQMAVAEITGFGREAVRSLNSDEPALEQALGRKIQRSVNEHFLTVEIYGPDGKLRFEAARDGASSIGREVAHYRHRIPEQGESSRELHYLEGRLLLAIVLPLEYPQGNPAGYFEGVYQVDPAQRAKLEEEIVHVIVLVTTSLALAAALLSPIIMNLNRWLVRLAATLFKGNVELLDVLGCAIAERDSDTNSHNYRVTLYALGFGQRLGLSRWELRNLIAGAFLHDVGKIGIRDPILLKPGRLTPEEFEVMKTHVTLGVDVLKRASWLQGARDVVEFHHEKYDGSGYLRGLSGEAIPLNARLFSIVDVFDALTSPRPYKQPWPVEEAVAALEKDSGTHFDPHLVRVFSTIAASLYRELHGLDDSRLEAILRKSMAKYFLSGA